MCFSWVVSFPASVVAELDALIALKRADHGGAEVDFGYWDFRYYMNKQMKVSLGFRSARISFLPS